MPRIKRIRVAPFNQVQDIPDDAYIELTGDVDYDLYVAVDDDYMNGIDMDRVNVSTSDIYHALENVSGAVAAGMLSGATECAHVDAVVCAYKFNRADWREQLARFYDPYRDLEWQAWHAKNGRTCPGCDATNYECGPDDTCGNCLCSLAMASPPGIDPTDFEDLVKGYVHALTWTDLQKACEDCDGTGNARQDDTPMAVECESCWGSGGAEPGSKPYKYGVEDLDSDALASIVQDCYGFALECRDDLAVWAEHRAYDPNEGSVWSYIGHDLYLTAAGHGTGFWDRFMAPRPPRVYSQARADAGDTYPYVVASLPAMWWLATAHKRKLALIGDRLTVASKPYSVPTLYLDADTGVISA